MAIKMVPVPQATDVDEATMTKAGWKKIGGVWNCPVEESTGQQPGELLESVRKKAKERIEAKITKDGITARLIESYKLLGLSPQECLIAAGVENRVLDDKYKVLGGKR